MKLKIFQILLILSFFVSCTFNAEKIDFSKESTPNLFEYFINTKDSVEMDLLIEMLQDSITKNPNFQFSTKDYFESEKEEFKVKFSYYDSRLDDIIFKKRNAYIIVINNRSHLQFEGKFISKFDEVTNEINEFVLNPEDKENLPQKKFEEIDYFGEVGISKQSFVIYLDLSDSLIYTSNWLKMKVTIHFINEMYQEIRNEIALQKFDKPFRKLEIKQKESIIELVSTRITIIPNWEEWEIMKRLHNLNE